MKIKNRMTMDERFLDANGNSAEAKALNNSGVNGAYRNSERIKKALHIPYKALFFRESKSRHGRLLLAWSDCSRTLFSRCIHKLVCG